jgi:hypothetical protein
VKKRITVTIKPDGTYTIGAQGYGPDCEKATRALEDMLGSRRSHKRTAEFAEGKVKVKQ